MGTKLCIALGGGLYPVRTACVGSAIRLVTLRTLAAASGTKPQCKVLPACAFQICPGEIQQGVIAKTVRVALAELGDIDDAQGEPLPRRAHVTFGGKWSAAVLDRLPCLVERVHQYPHLVVVEGAGERVFCQELEHGPPGTGYLRATVAG